MEETRHQLQVRIRAERIGRQRRSLGEETNMSSRSDRAITGWFVMGPMESVCVDDAPTADQARQIYEDRLRWVADVWEIRDGEQAALDEVRCAVCNKLIAA